MTAVKLADVTAASVAEPSESSLVVYLGDDVTVSGTTMIGEYAKTSYRINSAAVCGEDVALTTNDLEGYGVWVVYTPDTYNTVSHVYVGKALGETANMIATVKEGTATTENLFDVNNETWTYTGTNGASVTLTAAALNNATFTVNNSGKYTLSNVTQWKPFTVKSENGNVINSYYVKLESEVSNTFGLSGVGTLTVQRNVIGSNIKTVYNTLQDALDNASVVTLTYSDGNKVSLNSTDEYVAVGVYNNKTEALAGAATDLAIVSGDGHNTTAEITSANIAKGTTIVAAFSSGWTNYYVAYVVE